MLEDQKLAEQLSRTASDFAELTKMGKAEPMHAYAMPNAQDVAMCLFHLSLLTKTEVGMQLKRSDILRVLGKVEAIQREALNKRDHYWVRGICDTACVLIKECLPFCRFG